VSVANDLYSDAVLNLGSGGSDSVSIDTKNPNAPLITTVADNATPVEGNVLNNGSTNDTTPTLSGTAEAGSTVTIRDGTTVLGTATANNTTGAWTFTPAALPQGAHNFSTTATDAAGNISTASNSYSVSIDTAAPAAPTITSVNDNVAPITGNVINGGSTNDTTPTLSGGAEAGSTVTIKDGTTVLGTALADNTGVWTFTPTALPQGAHNFSVTATDAVGNVSTASNNYAVTISIAPLAVGDSFTGNEDTPITGNVLTNDANVTSATLVTNAAHGTVTLNPNGTFTYTPVANYNGPDSFTYQATDGTTNSNTVTVSLNVIPVNDAPTTVADIVLTNGGNSAQIVIPEWALVANDIDVDSTLDVLSVSNIVPGGSGTVAQIPGVGNNGTVTFTDTNPGGGSFSYITTDGSLTGSAVNVSITNNNGNITGTGANEILIGFGKSTLNGGAGNDVLIGDGSGNGDTLIGGAGNDIVVYKASSGDGKGVTVTIHGDTAAAVAGTDSDTLVVSQTTAGLTINLSLANQTSENTNTTVTGFENVDASRSTVAVTLIGSSGANTLIGGSGVDSISAGAGNDILVGGAGADVLSGGLGSDTFRFVKSGTGSVDTVTDFKTSEGDVLDVSDLLIGYNPANASQYIQLVESGGNTTVRIDRDGAGTAYTFEDVAVLTGVTGLDLNTLLANGTIDATF
jgi:VCBS repeat-containing protein